jgi:hypothetical protein
MEFRLSMEQVRLIKMYLNEVEVNAKKTKYMLTSGHQNAGKNHDIKIVNRSFEYMAKI